MSITLAMIIAFIGGNASSWLAILRTAIFDTSGKAAAEMSKGLVVSKGGGLIRRVLHLDEKEQIRHLEQALKNATERGLANFTTPTEQEQYKYVLHTLMQIGPHSEKLRTEALRLFTLSDAPDFTSLNDAYNLAQQDTALSHKEVYANITITPYLTSFFNALIAELYADPYFKQQMRDTLQIRATLNMQQALFDVVTLLREIGETLEHTYTPEHLVQDIEQYTAYLQRTFHHLKIVGIVPKDQGRRDPELGRIFVPLRIALQNQYRPHDRQPDSIIDALEAFPPYLVLLGGPGSGKSTAIRYLTWSHADAHRPAKLSSRQIILSGAPLPLLIELRRLSEARRQANYDFLSFVTEVILHREGIEINQQMFKELLKRRAMLLLFDGLDEVTTPDERIELVQEIEHFTLSYPGNRVIVTSRPVGYDLARLSGQLFAHAEVQPFNNDQIHQFLLNWYSAVLGLSPIPQTDLQELDLLCQTLQDNTRLHKLAENPLLLTVITALHRYERLPDRRVLIYDRCADLLLETWAKVKGTHIRWKDMKMVKEDQYACIAHLGFVLHEQSQKESQGQNKKGTEDLTDITLWGPLQENGDKTEEITSDVTIRVLLQEIERFLKSRNLIAEIAHQRSEAKLFIELMKIEAGLIVERGTETNGELLYGFVHRTFQEYFAAADVYERFLQEVDLTIVSDFLVEHLHDPHWHEVILLLLGKLPSRPVTKLLSQILQGTLLSRRSRGTAILEQDLFFLCDCLVEEITVEADLITLVIARLHDIIKYSVLSSQRREAADYLGALTQTRQYSYQSRQELNYLALTKEIDLSIKIDVLRSLYQSSPQNSEERQFVTEVFRNLLKDSNFFVEDAWKMTASLFWSDPYSPEQEQFALEILKILIKHPNLSVEQVYLTVESFLHSFSPRASEQMLYADEILRNLLQRTDLSIEQKSQTADFLYQISPKDSEMGQFAIEILTNLLQRPDLSTEQKCQAAESLYKKSPIGSQGRLFATEVLTNLLQQPDFSPDQVRLTVESLYKYSQIASQEEQLAIEIFTKLLQRPDLSIEQIHLTAASLYKKSPIGSQGRLFATEVLTNLLQRPDLSTEQKCQAAESLYKYSPTASQERLLATEVLTNLFQQPDFSPDQVRLTVEFLYKHRQITSQGRLFATEALTNLLQRPDLSVDQVLLTAESLYNYSPTASQEEQFAIQIITKLLQHPDLSIEQQCRTAESLYQKSPTGSQEEQLAIETFTKLFQRSDLPIEQVRLTAESLYQKRPEDSQEEHLTTEILTKLLQRNDLSIEQTRLTAISLYQKSLIDSQEEHLAIHILTQMLQCPDLSIEQTRLTAESLHKSSSQNSEQEYFATAKLLSLIQKAPLTKDWDNTYTILRRMVPQFTKLSSLAEP